MSGTVENTNNNIILKFKYIIYLLNIIIDYLYNKSNFELFFVTYNNIVNKNDIFFMYNNIVNKQDQTYSNDILYEYSSNIIIKKNYSDEIKTIINSVTDLKYEYE